MESVLTVGANRAEDSPVCGLTAPNRYTHSSSVCWVAVGREPVRPQQGVRVPCWPIRASSWNQTSIRWLGCSCAVFWAKGGLVRPSAVPGPDHSCGGGDGEPSKKSPADATSHTPPARY